MSLPYVIVGTPCFASQVTAQYARSVLKLQMACYRRGDVGFNALAQWGDALIQRARQDIVARFLSNPTATHLLFADADIGFEPEQLFRLLDFGVDMAAAPYPDKRGKPVGPENGKDWDSSFELLEPPVEVQSGGFARARRVGLGFTLIRRAVFERMMERYPQLRYSGTFTMGDPLAKSPYRYAFFNCGVEEERYLSEDHAFCRRWTQMGGEIWLDLKRRVRHVGPVALE